jgi:hypothetical protein
MWLTWALQVYLAIAALLANGGQLKSGAAVAEAAVDSISSEATKAMKQLRKSVTNPLAMLRGGEKKPAAEATPLYVGPRCVAKLRFHAHHMRISVRNAMLAAHSVVVSMPNAMQRAHFKRKLVTEGVCEAAVHTSSSRGHALLLCTWQQHR